ncbi:MAG: lyase family protein [Bacilli bacterium]|nr:lyase family protein [Bacilli bacterium]
MKFRIEKDELGELQVPAEAYYGIQTLRSKNIFEIAKRPISRQMIKGLAVVKKAAAKANVDAGFITKEVGEAIALSCDELLNGRLHGQFITDLVQGGAGSSMNMNANEVIANRANEMLKSEKGKYDKVHPINDVNFCQSSNDVVPTAGKIATIRLTKKLLVEMKKLINAYYDKAEAFKDVVTIGKTHLLDSSLITFGQIFNALAHSVERDAKKIEQAMNTLYEINLGGTVSGTGINAGAIYSKKVLKYLNQFSGEEFYQAKDLVDSTRHLDGFAWLSSAVKTFALNLNKVANDMRLMATVYKSITLPHIMPGSSFSPGKFNPVVPEMVNQVVYYIEGNDLTICRSVSEGEMEFNVNLPIILACLFENLNFVRRAIRTLREKAIEGLETIDIQEEYKESNAVITTFLPLLGYEMCEQIYSTSVKENKTILKVIEERGILTSEQIQELLFHSLQPGLPYEKTNKTS